MKDGLPSASICVPTFNGATYFSAALKSIEEQHFRKLEVVISDDGSTDGTWEIAEEYQKNASFAVKLLRHKQDTIAGNWNFCMSHAKSEYIKYLFQDDVLAPDCVGAMLSAAVSDPAVGLVFSPRHLLVMEKASHNAACQSIIKHCSVLHESWTDLKPLQRGIDLLKDPALFCKSPWNKVGEPSVVLIRKSLAERLGGFDTELRQLVDLEMWWRLMAHAKIAFLQTPLSSFRIHPGQESIKKPSFWRGFS